MSGDHTSVVLLGRLPPEFGREAGLAHAGLAHDGDEMRAVACDGGGQGRAEYDHLVVASDEGRLGASLP